MSEKEIISMIKNQEIIEIKQRLNCYKDFEKVKKECLKLWYKAIQKHTKAKPNLADNKNYIAIANSYKPFEDSHNPYLKNMVHDQEQRGISQLKKSR